jgi:hypothetical protein
MLILIGRLNAAINVKVRRECDQSLQKNDLFLALIHVVFDVITFSSQVEHYLSF